MPINVNLANYAINSDGSYDFRYPAGDKPAGGALDVPTNISAVANGSAIDITWTDAAGTTSTFIFSGTTSGSLTYHGFADVGEQAYTIPSLANDTYYVALMSHNSGADTYSALSAEETVVIDVTPSAPSGDTFTITGSGFGTKSQAAPIKWDQFKDYADDSTLQSNDSDWPQYQTNGGALIKSDRPRYAGGKYVYNDDTRSGFATNYHTFAPTDEVFLSYWFSTDQVTFGGGGTYWIGKLSRISSSTASGGGGVYNGVGVHALSNQNPANNSSPYIYQYNGNNTLGEVIDYITMPNANTWVRVDMYAKLSDLDVANGTFNCHSWGYENYTNTSIPSRVTGNNYQLDSVILGLMHANHSGASGGLKITDVYIDNTRQRVELCDTADYTQASWSEVQPWISWSDTSIECLENKAGRTGTAYRHVLNDLGISIHNEQVTL